MRDRAAAHDDTDPDAGDWVADGWDLVDGTGENYGWPTLVRKGGDDVRLDPGAVPAGPAN